MLELTSSSLHKHAKDRVMRKSGILACVLLAAAAGGCENGSGGKAADSGGTDGATGGAGGDSTGGEQAACGAPQPGPSPIRRMNRFEYDNTVRDLLGDDSRPAQGFPDEEEALGFNNNADALGVTGLLAEHYLTAAETLAAKAALDLPKLLGCDPQADGEDACARRFVTEFGRRAYRRPLEDAEVDALFAVFAGARAQFDFETGIRLTLTAMLQSPHFLYRVEFGAPIASDDAALKVRPYELASRLSYFLWATMPDDALFEAAASGALETREDVAAQAQRMLADPRARVTVRDFHGQWLYLSRIEQMEKDPDVFPEFDPAIKPQLRAEAEAFLEHVIWDGEGDLDTLLLAPFTFMNKPLADYYGVTGPAGDALEKVELPEGHASGILTLGGVMAFLAKPNQTSPIHRGKFIRERILCQAVPPPPDNIVITPPEVDPNLPTRERFKEHSEDPLCGGCHQLLDPVGFGFEHYDGLGRWRDIDAKLPIDASGEVIAAEVAGKFDGVPDLAAMLVSSPEVEGCMTRQWFRYAYGRAETLDDKCTLDQLGDGFAASGRNIQDLIVALTQTDAFMYRRAQTGEGGSP